MKKIVCIVACALVFSCHAPDQAKDKNKVYLKPNQLTIAKRTDTLVISENTCKGCAYEYATHFDVEDSLGMTKLDRIVTTDNDRSGTVNKDLFLVPVKTGRTSIKLYKYYHQKPTAEDSAQGAVYSIEIKN